MQCATWSRRPLVPFAKVSHFTLEINFEFEGAQLTCWCLRGIPWRAPPRAIAAPRSARCQRARMSGGGAVARS